MDLKAYVIAGVTLLLSGCFSTPEPLEQVFRCSDSFDVLISNRTETDLQADIDGEHYRLRRVPSASGDKFQTDDANMQLWFKGHEASLKLLSYPIQICTLVVPNNRVEPSY